MGSLLRSQIERIVIALEARPNRVRSQDWWECRDLWNVYFLKFRELTECLWDDYLKPLTSECATKDIRQEFGQDFEAIHELCDSMIVYRQRIEDVRSEKCVLRQPDGRKIMLAYGQSVLEPASWERYVRVVQKRRENIDIAVLG
jgi:hypothetical protein